LVSRSESFKYDPFGRRIYKSSSSGTSIYAYDFDNLIEETNSSGSAVARYAQTDNTDEPMAMLRSGTTSYYHADGLGSVTSLSNTAGALAQTYTFDRSYIPYRASARSARPRSKWWVRRISRYPNLSPMHSLWSA